MKTALLSRAAKIAIALALLIWLVALIYTRSRGIISANLNSILSLAFGAVAIIFVKLAGTSSNDKRPSTFGHFHIVWKNIAKAAACLISMVVWISIAVSYFIDTTAGYFILLAPLLILGTATLFYISRSY